MANMNNNRVWADIASSSERKVAAVASPRQGAFLPQPIVEHPVSTKGPRQILVGKPSRQGPRLAPRQGPRGKPKGGRKSGGKKFNFGDLTLRDAADVTGAVLRGGVKLATAIFNVEEKIFDTQISAVVHGATVVNLSNIGQGDNYNNRQGLSVMARNLVFNYILYLAGSTNNFVRIIIFQDMEQTGVDPAPADVLEDASSAAKALVSPYLRYTGDRYRILTDEHHSLCASSPTNFMNRRLVMPIDNHILFQSTTGADASNWNGALYMMYMSDVAASGPALTAHARLTYVDN